MAVNQEIAYLQKQVRQLRLIVLTLAIIGGVLGLSGFNQTKTNVQFDELTVGRLNIAGPDKVNRIVIAHTMPMAPFDGVELNRTVPPGLAGMIFCAPNGDEVGGIGVSGDKNRGHALLALDYRGVPLEAIGLVTRYTDDSQSAGLVIQNPPTSKINVQKIKDNDEAEVKKLTDQMITRVSLGASNGAAELLIADNNGKDRIKIGVNDKNEPIVAILDESGKVVSQLGGKY